VHFCEHRTTDLRKPHETGEAVSYSRNSLTVTNSIDIEDYLLPIDVDEYLTVGRKILTIEVKLAIKLS
jgi:hypothetical protein